MRGLTLVAVVLLVSLVVVVYADEATNTTTTKAAPTGPTTIIKQCNWKSKCLHYKHRQKLKQIYKAHNARWLQARRKHWQKRKAAYKLKVAHYAQKVRAQESKYNAILKRWRVDHTSLKDTFAKARAQKLAVDREANEGHKAILRKLKQTREDAKTAVTETTVRLSHAERQSARFNARVQRRTHKLAHLKQQLENAKAAAAAAANALATVTAAAAGALRVDAATNELKLRNKHVERLQVAVGDAERKLTVATADANQASLTVQNQKNALSALQNRYTDALQVYRTKVVELKAVWAKQREARGREYRQHVATLKASRQKIDAERQKHVRRLQRINRERLNALAEHEKFWQEKLKSLRKRYKAELKKRYQMWKAQYEAEKKALQRARIARRMLKRQHVAAANQQKAAAAAAEHARRSAIASDRVKEKQALQQRLAVYKKSIQAALQNQNAEERQAVINLTMEAKRNFLNELAQMKLAHAKDQQERSAKLAGELKESMLKHVAERLRLRKEAAKQRRLMKEFRARMDKMLHAQRVQVRLAKWKLKLAAKQHNMHLSFFKQKIAEMQKKHQEAIQTAQREAAEARHNKLRELRRLLRAQRVEHESELKKIRKQALADERRQKQEISAHQRALNKARRAEAHTTRREARRRARIARRKAAKARRRARRAALKAKREQKAKARRERLAKLKAEKAARARLRGKPTTDRPETPLSASARRAARRRKRLSRKRRRLGRKRRARRRTKLQRVMRAYWKVHGRLMRLMERVYNLVKKRAVAAEAVRTAPTEKNQKRLVAINARLTKLQARVNKLAAKAQTLAYRAQKYGARIPVQPPKRADPAKKANLEAKARALARALFQDELRKHINYIRQRFRHHHGRLIAQMRTARQRFDKYARKLMKHHRNKLNLAYRRIREKKKLFKQKVKRHRTRYIGSLRKHRARVIKHNKRVHAFLKARKRHNAQLDSFRTQYKRLTGEYNEQMAALKRKMQLHDDQVADFNRQQQAVKKP